MKRIFALILMVPLLALAQPKGDISLKVALTYNFAKFTKWSDSQVTDELTFCYYDKGYKDAFSQLNGKKVAKRQIKTRKLSYSDKLNDCQLLYLSKNDHETITDILLGALSLPVLTVSDTSSFMDLGGMIELTPVNNKMRFKIDNARIQQAKLVLSSKVLKLALEVK